MGERLPDSSQPQNSYGLPLDFEKRCRPEEVTGVMLIQYLFRKGASEGENHCEDVFRNTRHMHPAGVRDRHAFSFLVGGSRDALRAGAGGLDPAESSRLRQQ